MNRTLATEVAALKFAVLKFELKFDNKSFNFTKCIVLFLLVVALVVSSLLYSGMRYI